MPTIRDVHSAFERMIFEQKKITAALQTEREQTRVLKREAQDNLNLWFTTARVAPDLSEPTLTLLDKAMSKIWAGVKNPVALAKDAQHTDFKTQEKLERHLREWGQISELEMQRDNAKAALSCVNVENAAHRKQEMFLTRLLADVITFNATWPALPLTHENRAHYEGFKLWSYLSDRQYRRGHGLLTAHVRGGRNVFDDQAAVEVAGAGLKSTARQGAELAGKRDVITGRIDDIAALHALYQGPDKILQTLQANVKTLLVENKNFAADLAQYLPTHYARPLMMAALKMQHYAKIEDRLDQTLKQVLATTRNLESPMSKLAKGKRYKPNKSISIDLQKIEDSVKAQRAIGSYHCISAHRARNAIDEYVPPRNDRARNDGANNDMASMQNLMLLYIIMSSGTDPAYVNQTFDLNADVAAQANIDLTTLVPDIAGAVGNIDLGNIDIGSIDVGSIDIGAIDVGNNDNWGGGNLDSGGGASFD